MKPPFQFAALPVGGLVQLDRTHVADQHDFLPVALKTAQFVRRQQRPRGLRKCCARPLPLVGDGFDGALAEQSFGMLRRFSSLVCRSRGFAAARSWRSASASRDRRARRAGPCSEKIGHSTTWYLRKVAQPLGQMLRSCREVGSLVDDERAPSSRARGRALHRQPPRTPSRGARSRTLTGESGCIAGAG